MSRSQYLLRYGQVGVLSKAGPLCGSHSFQNNCQLFGTQTRAICRKFLVSLEFPDRHSLLIAAMPLSHWSPLNIARNPEYWGQEIVQASWLSRSILSPTHRKSYSCAVWQCGENEVIPRHAWTTCYVFDEEAHVPWILVYHSRRYTVPLSLLGKATGPERLITWNTHPDIDSPISRQALISSHMLPRTFFCSFEWLLWALKAFKNFNILCRVRWLNEMSD
jgi:hypothetical protein